MRTTPNPVVRKETSIGGITILFRRSKFKDGWLFKGVPLLNGIPVQIINGGQYVEIDRVLSKTILRNVARGVTINDLLEPAIHDVFEYLIKLREEMRRKKPSKSTTPYAE